MAMLREGGAVSAPPSGLAVRLGHWGWCTQPLAVSVSFKLGSPSVRVAMVGSASLWGPLVTTGSSASHPPGLWALPLPG